MFACASRSEPVRSRPWPFVRHQFGTYLSLVSALRAHETGERRSVDDLPAHSLATLTDGLATLTPNLALLPNCPDAPIPLLVELTALQLRALELLGIDAARSVPRNATG